MGRGKAVEIDVVTAARLYSEVKSLQKTALMLGVDDATLRYRFIKHGVAINSQGGVKKLKLNQDFFEAIDSEIKAYWLGFLFADGGVYVGRQGYKLMVGLARKDRCLLEKLLIDLGADNPIKDKIIKKKDCAYKESEYPVSVVVISSKKLVSDLVNLGCVPKKSLVLRFPTIREDLVRHFIRGYFDGDGCICLSKKSRTPWNWSLLGTKSFLETVQSILVCKCGLSETKIAKSKKIYRLSYGGRMNVLKISNFFYEGASIYLERKAIKMKTSEGK